MVRRKSRTLTQGPFGSPEGGPQRGEAGKPPWWPEWMPWIDIGATLRSTAEMHRKYADWVTEGRETELTRESVSEAFGGAMDIYEDWYKKAKKAVDERMRR